MKTKTHIKQVLTNTIPIDTWIIENTISNKNNWGQKVPILSDLCDVYEENKTFDRLVYYVPFGDSARGKTKHRTLFEIRYYTTSLILSVLDNRLDENCSVKLAYEEPTMFDKLENVIWNIYTLYMIQEDITAMLGNLAILEKHVWDNALTFLHKRMSVAGRLLESTGETEQNIRNLIAEHIRDPDD